MDGDGVHGPGPSHNPATVEPGVPQYGEVVARDLRAADMRAVTRCRDSKPSALGSELLGEGNVGRAVKSEKIGTPVSNPGTRG